MREEFGDRREPLVSTDVPKPDRAAGRSIEPGRNRSQNKSRTQDIFIGLSIYLDTCEMSELLVCEGKFMRPICLPRGTWVPKLAGEVVSVQ